MAEEHFSVGAICVDVIELHSSVVTPGVQGNLEMHKQQYQGLTLRFRARGPKRCLGKN